MLEVIFNAFAKYEEDMEKRNAARSRNKQKHTPDRGADLEERLRGH